MQDFIFNVALFICLALPTIVYP